MVCLPRVAKPFVEAMRVLPAQGARGLDPRAPGLGRSVLGRGDQCPTDAARAHPLVNNERRDSAPRTGLVSNRNEVDRRRADDAFLVDRDEDARPSINLKFGDAPRHLSLVDVVAELSEEA